jgi:two-component system, cell cycle response regulator CpdR
LFVSKLCIINLKVSDDLKNMSTNRIICIVDDDADITLLFHDILNSITGITVQTFTDPILALQHFQINEHAYVLVISDFKMSGLNGMEFLKKIKDLNPSVRTILMTAFQIDGKVFLAIQRKKLSMHSFKSL